ncbi:MAG: hypothetical protein PHV39_00125 [Methanomicrobium sp.]|nr:hypothetical protein [Methanomicrobium sp.]
MPGTDSKTNRSSKDKTDSGYRYPQIRLKNEFLKYVSEIKDKSFEHAVIFNESGKFLFRMKGTRNSIDFKHSDLYRMQGKIFMHNHPCGGGFSLPDIRSACALNMAGMIVATEKFLFIFFPSPEKENFRISDYKNILKCYQIRQNLIPLSKRFQPDDEIWKIVACDLGYQYLKIRLKNE